jgi:cobalt-zinc-cadmium efflux system protein
VLVVACLGLVVNVGSALGLARSRRENLNLRGAFIHMTADAAGSIAVILAAVLVLAVGVYWVDPVAALVVGLLVVWSAGRLLAQSTHILMEGTPRHVDFQEAAAAIESVAGVDGVHHLHVWSLGSQTLALSAHVTVTGTGSRSLAEAQGVGNRIREVLAERFGISHATLELEDQSCE